MKKKITAAVLSVACVATLGGAAIREDGLDVNAYTLTTDLLQTEMEVSANETLPQSAGSSDYRTGLQLTARKDGEKAKFKQTMSGEFSLEYTAWSRTSYEGTAYEETTNQYQDLNELSIIVQDANDANNRFRIRLTGGGYSNGVTVQASVEANDVRSGIYYYRDTEELGNTTGANALGGYTCLWGTGYSNTAVARGAYASSNVRPVKIAFDPSTMRISAWSYGYSRSAGKEILVWDYSMSENDGRDIGFTLGGFEEYTVELEATDIREDEANILIYSVNGQTTYAGTITDTVAPTIYAPKFSGVDGAKTVLPTLKAFDFSEGAIAAETIAVKVKDAFGRIYPVYAPSGEEASVYAEGCYVRLDAGDYELICTARDGAGNSAARSFGFTISAEKITLVGDGLEAAYEIGKELALPVMKARLDGVEYTTERSVLLPDGTRSTAATLTLTDAGKYTAYYAFEAGGQAYTVAKEFFAAKRSTELFKAVNSEISYGAANLHVGLTGVKASVVTEGGGVEYVGEISTESCTKDTPLIAFSVAPTVRGSEECRQLVVTLTDGENAENKIEIVVRCDESTMDALIRAGASGQQLAGLDRDDVETDSNGGMRLAHSFSGEMRSMAMDGEGVVIAFDYATKCVYINGSLLADFDSAEFFTKIWDGFDSDSFRLSVSAEALSGQAHFIVTNVLGQSTRGEYLCDTTAPTLTIERTEIPTGKVGLAFPLPPAIVSDNASRAETSVRVVHKDGREYAVEDNKFTPDQVGKYIVTYTATDAMGNQTSKTVNLYVENDIVELTVWATDVPSELLVGFTEILPQAQASFPASVEILAVKDDEENDVSDGFLPTEEGVYTIVYRATDWFGRTAETSYPVIVTATEEPVFGAIVGLPEVIVVGQEITLPSVTATDYKRGQSVTVSAGVQVGSNFYAAQNDKVTVPVTETADTARIVYLATTEDGREAEYEAELPLCAVVNEAGELDMSEYFLLNGVSSVEKKDESIIFRTQTSGASMKFIKALPAGQFAVKFDVAATSTTDVVYVVLTGAENKNEQVTLTIKRGASGTNVSTLEVNGKTYTIPGSFYGNAVYSLEVKYDDLTYTVFNAMDVEVCKIKEYDNGQAFRGFTGGGVMMELVFGDVQTTAELELYSIVNQGMNNGTSDLIKPVVNLSGVIQTTAEMNEEFTVYAAQAYDVLSFATSLTVSVIAPDKSKIVNEIVPTESFTVKATAYGTYRIVYTAKDAAGRSFTLTKSVAVLDRVLPTIEVEDLPTKITVGETVEIPAAKVTDNMSGDLYSYIYVLDPDGMITTISAGKVTFASKGVYIVRYYAEDATGNVALLDKTVTVE